MSKQSDRLMSESAPAAKRDRLMSEGLPKGGSVFDPDLWLAGVKPIERTLRLYQRLDLLADRDEAAAARQELRLSDPADSTGEQAALTEKIRGLTSEINGSALQLRLRGFTRSRAQEIIREAESLHLKDDDAQYFWIAAHVAEPQGITWEWMKAVDDALPVQMLQIVTAVEQISNSIPDVEATLPL